MGHELEPAAGHWWGAAGGALVAGAWAALDATLSGRLAASLILFFAGTLGGLCATVLILALLRLIPDADRTLSDHPAAQIYLLLFFVLWGIAVSFHLRDRIPPPKAVPKPGRPILLDTSAIIDGRVADLAATGVIDSPLILPDFVLAELQRLADTGDRHKRIRGRRGLDVLSRIREEKKIELDTRRVAAVPGEPVDVQLIHLAKQTGARILTADISLERVAQVQGVEVISLVQLGRALRPPVMQGDRMQVELVRPGENPGQAVGFLEDGTMVVAEGCASRVGQKVDLLVKNVIQTTAGRIVFAEPEGTARRS